MTSPSPAWPARALAACDAGLRGAPLSLQGRLGVVLARLAKGRAEGLSDSMLKAPFLQPYFALTDAFRRDVGLPDEGAADAVGEGAVALYLYLRLQDDMIDEPAVFDPSYAYAAEVLAATGVEAFARAVGDAPAFWAFRRSILAELAGVSAWEIDAYRAMDPAAAAELAEEHAAALGSKLAPVAIPLAALAAAAGAASHLSWLGRFSRSFGCALQIANDLLNARDDHAAGRLTPSLAALYAGGRVAPGAEPFRVWPSLAADPALPRMLGAARRSIEAASSLAAGAGASALAAACAGSAALLDGVPRALLALALGVQG